MQGVLLKIGIWALILKFDFQEESVTPHPIKGMKLTFFFEEQEILKHGLFECS